MWLIGKTLLIYCWLFVSLVSVGHLAESMKRCAIPSRKSRRTTRNYRRKFTPSTTALRLLRRNFARHDVATAIRKLFAIWTVWFLFPQFADAAYIGQNTLGSFAEKFQYQACDAALNNINAAAHPVYTVIWKSSFGGNHDCLNRFEKANSHRDHSVNIYCGNGAGRRSRTLTAGDPYPRLTTAQWNGLLEVADPGALGVYSNCVREAHEWAQEHGGIHTQIVIFPDLEDYFSKAAYRIVSAQMSADIAGRYLFARNPAGSNRDRGDAYFLECHGSKCKCKGRTQIANLDGSVLSAKSREKWMKARVKEGCWQVIDYDPACQGREKDGDFSGNRANRDFHCSDRSKLYGKF